MTTVASKTERLGIVNFPPFRIRTEQPESARVLINQTIGCKQKFHEKSLAHHHRIRYFLSRQKQRNKMPTLSPVQQKFILHWGEMGTRWGINRTVAQIHALLYMSPKPIHAEEIADTLSVARSNVSNSLKELQGWGIVKRVHVLGDSRDHFESMKDVWEMFRVVLDERKKREIDPTLDMLRTCVTEAEKDKETDEYTEQKLRELADFFEVTTAWYVQVRKWPTAAMIKFVKLGDKVLKALGLGS